MENRQRSTNVREYCKKSFKIWQIVCIRYFRKRRAAMVESTTAVEEEDTEDVVAKRSGADWSILSGRRRVWSSFRACANRPVRLSRSTPLGQAADGDVVPRANHPSRHVLSPFLLPFFVFRLGGFFLLRRN